MIVAQVFCVSKKHCHFLKGAYIADVLVGLLGSTDLMSLWVHVDLGFALLIHLFVFQLKEESR